MDRSDEQADSYQQGVWHAIIGLELNKGNSFGCGWEEYRRGYLSVKPDAKEEDHAA